VNSVQSVETVTIDEFDSKSVYSLFCFTQFPIQKRQRIWTLAEWATSYCPRRSDPDETPQDIGQG